MGLVLLTVVTVSAQSTPYAATQNTSPITLTNAVLNGMAVPNGLPSVAWFEWGTNASLGNLSSLTNVGSGTAVVRVSAGISGLFPRGVYSCRLVVSNSSGVVHAPIQRFTTGRALIAWSGDSFLTNVPSGPSNWVTSISSGMDAGGDGPGHGLAIKPDGTMIGWGANWYGQANVPAGLSNVIAVSAGGTFSVALKADGTLAAWGDNRVGQIDVPFFLRDVVAIATGGYHGVALRADGTVIGWNSSVPAGLSNVVAVAAGLAHSIALKADGTVVGWGANYWGQLDIPPRLSNVITTSAAIQTSLPALAMSSKLLPMELPVKP